MIEKTIDYSDLYTFWLEGEYINKTECVKDFCSKHGINYLDSYRRNLSKMISKETPVTPDMDDSKVVPAVIDGKLLSIEEYCERYSLPFEDIKKYKLVTHSGSGAYYNIEFHTSADKYLLDNFGKKLIEDITAISTRPTTIERKTFEGDEHLLVLDVADLHIGKYSSAYEVGEKESYNVEKAISRAMEGVEGILAYSSGWKKDKIVFVAGNDMLHTDNPKKTTTSGTLQDTQGMFFENFLDAKELYINIINRLVQEADVHVMFNPDNHSYASGWFLIQLIEAYFKDCRNVTFDSSIAHRKYFKYGKNLISSTHGDGGKIETLPMSMANECEFWSECTRRYMYIHHFHHKITKDYPGVTIEAVRTASGTDSWHHRNQYQGSKKSIEGFIHHKEKGQISRLSWNY